MCIPGYDITEFIIKAADKKFTNCCRLLIRVVENYVCDEKEKLLERILAIRKSTQQKLLERSDRKSERYGARKIWCRTCQQNQKRSWLLREWCSAMAIINRHWLVTRAIFLLPISTWRIYSLKCMFRYRYSVHVMPCEIMTANVSWTETIHLIILTLKLVKLICRPTRRECHNQV